MEKLYKFFHGDFGVSATEYGLVLFLIATILVAAITLLGTSICSRLTSTANQFGS